MESYLVTALGSCYRHRKLWPYYCLLITW